MVPPERLLCVKLEDGLGWNEICPFLGVHVPETPWPTKHSTADFAIGMNVLLAPAWRRATIKLAMTLVAVMAAAGTSGWYLYTHGVPYMRALG